MKIDPYKSEQAYRAWQRRNEKGIPGLSRPNERLLRQFLRDMEQGINIGRGSRRGGRSYVRLNTLRTKLVVIAKLLRKLFGVQDMSAATEEQLHALFLAMRNGDIQKRDGGAYRSTADHVKIFRSFWHWHMTVQRKRGVTIEDRCLDLDDSRAKPPWVYLREEDVRRLCDHAKHDYRVLIIFLYDTGIRSPTELVNVRVDDLLDNCTKLRIRDAPSKTFGRTINLMRCPDLLRAHIKERQLGPSDQLFRISPSVVNRYLHRLAARVLGNHRTLGGAHYSELTMYDLRHSSACYWLPRYKSESALKYRFGWKRSAMIHYYTEFLGMKDTITEDDLCTAPERNAIEKRLKEAEQEKRVLEEQLHALQSQMDEILTVVNGLVRKAG